MKTIQDILEKMVNACPVKCSVSVRKDSDDPNIFLRWRFENSAKQLCGYQRAVDLFELYHYRDSEGFLQSLIDMASAEIDKHLTKRIEKESVKL